MKRIPTFLLIILLCVTSNAKKYETYVSMFGNCSFSGKTVFIEPLENYTSSNDLEFKFYSEYLYQSFILNGAFPAASANDADYLVEASFSASDPRVVGSVSRSVSSGTVTPNPWGASSFGSSRTRSKNITAYDRKVLIVVLDNKSENKDMVWKAMLESEGAKDYLGNIVAYILEDSWSSFGTQGYKTLKASADKDSPFYNRSIYSQNGTYWPTCDNVNAPANMTIVSVSLGDEDTHIVIRVDKGDEIDISKKLKIECNGQEYKLSKVKGDIVTYPGDFYTKPDHTSFIELIFPAIPGHPDKITMSDKHHQWEGIHIK